MSQLASLDSQYLGFQEPHRSSKPLRRRLSTITASSCKGQVTELRWAIDGLERWLDTHQWKGYDPYDALRYGFLPKD